MHSKDCEWQIDYSSSDYWNNRYTEEEHFEWLDGGTYKYLLNKLGKDLLEVKSNLSDIKILIVGCGNSRLSEDLYQLGWKKILSTDISPICISNQKKKTNHLPGLEWEVLDMTKLSSVKNNSVDVVIDKAGLDAILANEKSAWNISQETAFLVDKALKEFSRVLSANGQFISVSFSQPHFRIPLYAKEKYQWDLDSHKLESDHQDSFGFFYYKMIKGQPLQIKKLESKLKLGNLKIDDSERDVIESSDDEAFISNIQT